MCQKELHRSNVPWPTTLHFSSENRNWFLFQGISLAFALFENAHTYVIKLLELLEKERKRKLRLKKPLITFIQNIFSYIFEGIRLCMWYLIGHSVCTRRRRQRAAVSLLGEHAKLIRRGVSALSCGTQSNPRGGCAVCPTFLHRRPDVQFIAGSTVYCIPPRYLLAGKRDAYAKGSTFLQLQSRYARHPRHTRSRRMHKSADAPRHRALVLSGDRRFAMLSFLSLSFILSHTLFMLVRYK